MSAAIHRHSPIFLFGAHASGVLSRIRVTSTPEACVPSPLRNIIATRERFESTVTPIECLHYALSLPTSVVITGIDSLEILEQAFEAVRTFPSVSKEELDASLAKTAEAALTGQYEPFKTTSIFDGTAEHPEWLGAEPQEFRTLMPA